ncbi:MAG: hypothetical protein K2M97_06640, partial [Muribaculaceae bacterium]|nr:hypothetical protein [Muribaculaceae bacterium]
MAERELSELLGASVTIGSVEIEPFTRLNIDDVAVADSSGRVIASIRRFGGGISPLRWMASGRLVISDVEIIGPQLHLWRASIGAPLNVDPILARLRSDRP